MKRDNRYSGMSIYSGKEPYVFISYAHKDSERVLPIIEKMIGRGYRVWMDLGIEAGTEWSNNIAAHLRDCAAFVAFLSRDSVASENCLDEIAYAKSHKKPSLMIFLEEEVTLPEGAEMQTARFQRMYMTRQESLGGFLEQIEKADMLHPCRADLTGGEMHSAAPAESKKAKSTIVTCALIVAAVLVVVCACVFFLPDTGGEGSDSVQNAGQDTSSAADSGSSKPEPPTEISDILTDMTFELEGAVYQIPFEYSTLTGNGWTISDRAYSKDTLIGGHSRLTLGMARDGSHVSITLYNPSGNAQAVSECAVVSLRAFNGQVRSFRISGGLTLGCGANRITELFGTPNDRSAWGGEEKLTYYKDKNSETGISFYCSEDGSDNSIVFTDVVPDVQTETSTELPGYLSQYRAPELLGEDILLGIMKLEDKMYQLPAPVSEFTAAGWQITSKPDAVPALGKDRITVAKGGVSLELTVRNSDLLQTLPEYCEVTEITVEGVSCEIPGGFYIGMTAQEASEKAARYFSDNDRYETDTAVKYDLTDFGRDYVITIDVDKVNGVKKIRINVSYT